MDRGGRPEPRRRLVDSDLEPFAAFPAHPMLARGGADHRVSALDGIGSGERRDGGDRGMHAHAHFVPWNEKAQADTGRREVCDKNAFMAVMPRDGLHLARGKLPGLGDYRTRVTTYLATPEYGPMPDFDHEAMIAHSRVRRAQGHPAGVHRARQGAGLGPRPGRGLGKPVRGARSTVRSEK